jgi:hypothetical protein
VPGLTVISERLRRRILRLIANCEYPPDPVNVENESSVTAVLVEELEDSRSQGHELGPGEGLQHAAGVR